MKTYRLKLVLLHANVNKAPYERRSEILLINI